jgi:hypothetical protein
MKKLLVNIFSDASNRDLDLTKILGAIAFLVFLILSGHNYGFKGSTWNPMEWTTAAGILLAAVGGVSKLKDASGTPPANKPDPDK